MSDPVIVYECCAGRHGRTIESVDFSEDGSLVAISMVSHGDAATDLYRGIWDGQRLYNLVQLTATRWLWELDPVWIGENYSLLLNRVNNISQFSYWTMAWDGTDQQMLLDYSGSDDVETFWFGPDGDLIVYEEWADETLHLFGSRLSDRSRTIRLTVSPSHFHSFRGFSPGGQRVLVLRNVPGALSGDALLSVSIDGGDEQQIYHTDQSSIGEASWSPDGEWIAFSMMRGELNHLYIIRSDGTDLTRVTDDGMSWISSPTWAISPLPGP